MNAIASQLFQRLKELPPNRLAEVADFVEFIAQRETRAAAAQRLAENMKKLDDLNLPPLSEDEVEDELQATRRELRAGRKDQSA